MNRYSENGSILQQQTSHKLQDYMAQVYGWMTCGLLLTAFVSWFASRIPALMEFLFVNRAVCFGLIITQLFIVLFLSSMAHRLSSSILTGSFMCYSMLNGLLLSELFLVYTHASIASTFFITASTFGIMSVYGYTTKKDLSRFSSLLLMTLIGIVLASLVNILLKNPIVMWLITYASVFVFVFLTAHDTQKLKNIGASINLNDHNSVRHSSILGALTLYLDFINLFVILIKFFGERNNK
ncbi:MAG: Bax inhibitor-1/YccA family protein [Pantoea sp. Brub]|nr:Bax inhibitor-1/YccA family protein [Pantoea sp. Brub]